MVDTNVRQQEEIKAVCSTFPEQCQQQYGYLVEQWEAVDTAIKQQWNGQDLAKIDMNSPEWMKYALFVSDPENQVAVASLGLLAKDIGVAAISFYASQYSDCDCQSIRSWDSMGAEEYKTRNAVGRFCR
ncbi:hypothetical protein [Escherichia coli]|uniref:hypothetical protein n=1 Tax=Escherichia coli TaxID=562 RepID=UPI000D257CB2|nr:hypothetical protein [Escherichia coli]AVZ57728.1 hypothetical protein DBZ19_08845 [Escherichia coli]NDO34812.1 hypothetical protein [Escherichia coli]